MAARPTPQDHNPKRTPFTFEADGATHRLPDPVKALDKVPARVFRDAMVEGGQAEAKLAFVAVEASGASKTALDALYSLPISQAQTIIADWLQTSGDGASLGE